MQSVFVNPLAVNPLAVTNKKDVEVSEQINLSCALHPLNDDEIKTCISIVRPCPESTIIPTATHHIDEHGQFRGFSFSCPTNSPISVLPLSRNMFHGHTACECNVSSADIVKLLSNIPKAKELMKQFLEALRERCKTSDTATFACRPHNIDGIKDGGNIISIKNKRSIDSQVSGYRLKEIESSLSLSPSLTHTQSFSRNGSQKSQKWLEYTMHLFEGITETQGCTSCSS